MAVPLTLQLIARTAGFKKSMDEAQSSFRKATKKILGDADGFRKIGTNFKSAGTTISLALGAPILALGGNIIKVAAEYEQAFVGVKKTVTASEEQFAALSTGIRKMATELPFAADDIAKVAEQAGQLGLKQDEILGFTKVVLDFVTSSNVPLEDAAVNLARLGVLSGEGTEKTSQLASAIVALGNDIKGNENEILELALNFGAMGKEIGISTEFALGFAASIVETGQKAEAGGTAMSEVFRRVSIAVAESGEELGAIAKIAGTTSAGFKKSLEEDAGEAIFALLEGINKIPGAAGDTLVAMDEIDFTGKRLGSTVLGLAGNITQTRKNIDLATKAYKENNASIQEAEKFYNTFISKIKILAGKFNETKIILGDTLIPIFERFIKDVLEPVAQKVSELGTEFSKLSPDRQEFFVQLAAALVVSGPILIGLGFMITAIGTIFNVVAVAFFGVGGIIAAVVALGFWLIKVTGNWDSFSDSISKTTDRLTKSVEQHGFFTTLLASIATRLPFVSTNLEEVASTLDLVEDAIAEMAGEAADSAADILGIGESFQEAKKKAKESTDGMKKGLSEVQKKAEEVSDAIKQASELESRRLKELMASDRAFGEKIDKEVKDELIRLTQAKAQALFDRQEAIKNHDKWKLAHANAALKSLKELLVKDEEDKNIRLEENKKIAILAANAIRDAIVNGLDNPKEAWKKFLASVVSVLVQMVIEAKFAGLAVATSMAVATVGISLVIALLASVFGSRKKKDTVIKDAVDQFLKEVERSLDGFEKRVVTSLERLNNIVARSDKSVSTIKRDLAAFEELQNIIKKDPIFGISRISRARLSGTSFRAGLIDELKDLGLLTPSDKGNAPRGAEVLNRIVRQLVKNSKLTIDFIEEEFDIKKKAIQEIFNLLKRERNFIKDIDSTITSVKREFFTPGQLFDAQNQDIVNIKKAVTLATGEEKLSLLKELKTALLASFNTAKSLFAPKNASQIEALKAEALALRDKVKKTPVDLARQAAIANKIETLTIQDLASQDKLTAAQNSVIKGLQGIKTDSRSAFQGLIDAELAHLKISKGSLVTQLNMEQLLRGLGNAQLVATSLIGRLVAAATRGTNPVEVTNLSRQFSTALNAFEGSGSSFASQLNALNGLPTLPMLASGGIVTKPMQAILGESGPEAVIPLSKANGLGTTINITLNVKDAASLSTNKWEQILKENLGTAMERINRQGFRSSLQPKVFT